MFLAPDTQASFLVPRFTMLVVGIEMAFPYSRRAALRLPTEAHLLKRSPSRERNWLSAETSQHKWR